MIRSQKGLFMRKSPEGVTKYKEIFKPGNNPLLPQVTSRSSQLKARSFSLTYTIPHPR